MPSYGVVIFDSEGRVLLRRPTNDFGGYVWTFAKGQQDPGETPEQTAVREAFEETGMRVQLGERIPGTFTSRGYSNVYWIATVTGLPGKPGWETARVQWFTPEEAKEKLKLSEKIYKNTQGTKRDLSVLEAAMKMKSRSRLGQAPADSFMTSGPKYIGGSNPGGVYTDANGNKRYIKFAQLDQQQVVVENFTNKFYNDMGVNALKTQVMRGVNPKTGNVELALVSDLIPIRRIPEDVPDNIVDQYVDGVVVDMFASNWDAGPHNLAIDANGSLIHMDQGGSFIFRAQGKPKPQSALMNPSETRTFFELGNLPFHMLYPYGYRDYADIAEQANRKIDEMIALRDAYGGWANYIAQKADYIHPTYAANLANVMETRLRWFDQNRP